MEWVLVAYLCLGGLPQCETILTLPAPSQLVCQRMLLTRQTTLPGRTRWLLALMGTAPTADLLIQCQRETSS